MAGSKSTQARFEKDKHLLYIPSPNPQRMHEGYCSRSVCPSVCLSVTTLTVTYLVCESKLRYYMVPYDVPNS